MVWIGCPHGTLPATVGDDKTSKFVRCTRTVVSAGELRPVDSVACIDQPPCDIFTVSINFCDNASVTTLACFYAGNFSSREFIYQKATSLFALPGIHLRSVNAPNTDSRCAYCKGIAIYDVRNARDRFRCEPSRDGAKKLHYRKVVQSASGYIWFQMVFSSNSIAEDPYWQLRSNILSRGVSRALSGENRHQSLEIGHVPHVLNISPHRNAKCVPAKISKPNG